MGGSVTKHDSEDALADQYGLPGGGGQPRLVMPPAGAIPAVSIVSEAESIPSEFPDSTVLQGDNRFINDDLVPAVFKWQHGGTDVYITGTFTNWREHKRMHRSGNDFTYMSMLPRGKHQFKFIVDGHWRWATDIRTETDEESNVNNIVDLTEFQRDDAEPLAEPDSDDEDYGTSVPDEVTYTKEPPYLPPQLRHILLNAAPLPAVHGTPVLPEPLPVTLDHLYCTAIRDGVMVQGLTRRFRSKHTSTVFYTLMPISPTLKVAEAADAAVSMSDADRSAIRTAVTAATVNPQDARTVAVGLGDGLREVMLSVLRARLDHLTSQLHQSSLREYQRTGRTLTVEETARLFDLVKGQAHRKLSTEDTDYRVIYGLLQLAHQAQQAAATPQ